MIPVLASVPDPQSSDLDTAALTAEVQGNLNALVAALDARAIEIYGGGGGRSDLADAKDLIRALARMLAGQSLSAAFGSPGDWGYGSPIGKALFPLHKAEKSRLMKLLAAAFSEPAGKLVPLEYPQADPAPCPYCGPVCYRGAEHNARVEDGAFFSPSAPERHIEYSRIEGRGIAALLDPAPMEPVDRVSYEEAAQRNRAWKVGA
ncbi:MAG TPA: hypothetical protein VII58_12635 [Acidobacteriaceae bacterium]